MRDLVKTGGGDLIKLLHGQGGEVVIPVPFAKDVFLFDTYIAGTTHIPDMDELEPQLAVADRLSFFREPDNPHDPQAIVIKTSSGAKIGYVPQRDNVIFARLMDAGKLLFGTITTKEKKRALGKNRYQSISPRMSCLCRGCMIVALADGVFVILYRRKKALTLEVFML